MLVATKLRGFINFWKSNLFDDRNSTNGNKLRTYREFKTEYTSLKMLLLDLDKLDISNFVKVIISNSRLFIEQGRYKKNPVENRILPLCSLNIEDELHFSIVCPKLDSPDKDSLKKL